MYKDIDWLKYLAPAFKVLICPISILFLWSFWSDPKIESDAELIEEIQL